MKIYTRFGDKGSTALLGGRVTTKSDLRVAAYGEVDELNSLLGVVITFNEDPESAGLLISIQKDLFVIGAKLAASDNKVKTPSLPPSRVEELEKTIDEIEEKLTPLKHFILPGGSRLAALFHHARTVCRRAERSIVALSEKEKIDLGIVTYMNRLSDLLFVMARFANRKKRIEETVWKG